MSDARRADVCVAACAEAWRGDGEIMASPMGAIPSIAARFAKEAFEPELLLSDGEAFFVANLLPVGIGDTGEDLHPAIVEGWIPFRRVFDTLWWGQRHVMMGATQIDRFGNQNISCIGPWEKPKSQLLGVRGAPGNTVNHTTSYWVPNHSARSFVERVDVVCGVGYDSARAAGPSAQRFHEIRMVVSNLGVFDFATPDNSMRVRTIHPGVTIDELVSATGFALVIPDDLPVTRSPDADELDSIADLDPKGTRYSEVPDG